VRLLNNKRIYLCENSIDGIFTAIYQAWNSRYGHNNNKIEEKSEDNHYSSLELFSEYIQVDTDYDLAFKVSRSIKEKISEEAYQMLCRVALSNHQGKADLIYRFMILGFHMGAKIMNHLSDESVGNVYKINRNVNYEAHHFLGFLRFSEQESGLLTAVIHPKNNVLTLIAPHFEDRLPEERFVIYDANRKVAALHMPGKPWILVEAQKFEISKLKDYSYEEDEYQILWKAFVQHIAIKERTNMKLQRNMLPIRFRADMTEFQSSETEFQSSDN